MLEFANFRILPPFDDQRQMSAETQTGDLELRELTDALVAMKLVDEGGEFAAQRLSGGVSCDVWRVDLPSGSICVKRALPRLRVTADWRAPPKRAEAETDWFHFVAGLNPNWVPEVLGQDRKRHMFAMEYLEPSTHPLWKGELASGNADPSFAARVGDVLAHIHAASAGREDVAHDFAHGVELLALRIEPYLLYTADKHAAVAPRIRQMAKDVAAARIALMQGDISPKNILHGPEGPVFLDAETACYGDPAFDLAFCTNHLLLKCVWHPEFRDGYLACFEALRDAYASGVTWEEPEDAEERAAALLSAFLLARIDGKSPVEYLTAETDKQFVRETALALLAKRGLDLLDVAEFWKDALLSR